MIKINRTITYRNTALATLLGLSLCVTSCPSSVMASTVSIDQMISRVDETSDNDLVRSHFEDASGNVYTNESADASGSHLKKASELPVRYDLREQGLTTRSGIRDLPAAAGHFQRSRRSSQTVSRTGCSRRIPLIFQKATLHGFPIIRQHLPRILPIGMVFPLQITIQILRFFQIRLHTAACPVLFPMITAVLQSSRPSR